MNLKTTATVTTINMLDIIPHLAKFSNGFVGVSDSIIPAGSQHYCLFLDVKLPGSVPVDATKTQLVREMICVLVTEAQATSSISRLRSVRNARSARAVAARKVT